MLQIHSIELTNICNLRCAHCPSFDSKYPRGMMSLKTFERALWCVKQITNFTVISGFGETFAHPQIEEMFTMAKQAGIYLAVPTNGIMLTQKTLQHCLDNNLTQLEVSVHTEKSLAAYKMAYETINPKYPNVKLIGNVMQCYAHKLKDWIARQGITEEQSKSLCIINMHNWALNEREYSEEENRKWQSKCEFLNHNICVIRWDGKVNTCCVDDGGVNYVGHIDDFPNLVHRPEEYKLCHKCSPAWFTGEQLGAMYSG